MGKTKAKRYVVTGHVRGRDMYAAVAIGHITSSAQQAKRWASFAAAEHAAQALANLTSTVWHVVDWEAGQ